MSEAQEPVGALLSVEDRPVDDLLEHADSGRLYAIVDGCDSPKALSRVRGATERQAICLYRGDAEEDLWMIAPYLMAVDRETFGWIRAELWEAPWGIFAISREKLEDVEKHFRRFLLVEDPDGQPMSFRYYDPRVLEAFLGTCERRELEFVFRGVEAYAIPAMGRHTIRLVRPLGPIKSRSSEANPTDRNWYRLGGSPH